MADSPVLGNVQFQKGDKQWLEYRKRSLEDLMWFAGVVLGYGDLVPLREPVHRLLCRFLEKRTGCVALDTKRFRKIELPRTTGKTTLGCVAYTIQRLCQNPDLAILIANEREQNAKDFLAEIKHHFETNEFLRSLFPEIIPTDFADTTWSANRINVKRATGRKEPSVSVIGVGGTVTGMHFDLIIVDDAISREAMENARAGTRTIMEQVNRWIHQLRPLLNNNAEPFAEIIFIGTRWYYGDSYEHIEEHFGYGEQPQRFLLKQTLPDGSKQSIPAYCVGDLAVFRRAAIEDGQSIFPDKWSLEDLAKMRLGDPALFAANMMNEPSDNVTATFKDEWLRTYDWLDQTQLRWIEGDGTTKMGQVDDLDRLIFVDPGGFGTASRGADRMRAAIVVTGSTERGGHLILEAWSESESFLRVADQIVGFVSRYRPRKLLVEEAGQQAAFIEVVRQRLRAAGLDVFVEPVKPASKDKDQRILMLEPFFQRGQVYIGKGASFHEFRTQYAHFPRGARKDLLDALAYGPASWRNPNAQRRTPKSNEEELRAYYTRRGLSFPIAGSAHGQQRTTR